MSKTRQFTLTEDEAQCLLIAIMRGAGGSVPEKDLAPLYAKIERKVAHASSRARNTMDPTSLFDSGRFRNAMN